jgi:hypothetical protein
LVQLWVSLCIFRVRHFKDKWLVSLRQDCHENLWWKHLKVYILGGNVNSEHLLTPYQGRNWKTRDTFQLLSKSTAHSYWDGIRTIGRSLRYHLRPLRVPLRAGLRYWLRYSSTTSASTGEKPTDYHCPNGNPAPRHVRRASDGRFLDKARWSTFSRLKWNWWPRR